mmetsp:Transcript_30430/g.46599  ORF Transcript_30430/g.46599 Transcript_30430/m.46599 type:complete len:123 (+) Transcript_30430:327-695(+)
MDLSFQEGDSSKVGFVSNDASTLSRTLETNTALLHANISLNKIGGDGAVALGEALRKNYTLQNLIIRSCNIGSKSVCAIASSLIPSFNHHESSALIKLNLSKNNIANKATVALGKMLGTNSL